MQMLDTWREDGSRVWHIGWLDVGYRGRAECIGGCEHWHQIDEEMPPRARVCAKARKALGALLGSRYTIREVDGLPPPAAGGVDPATYVENMYSGYDCEPNPDSEPE